jgi:hypothetical protein
MNAEGEAGVVDIHPAVRQPAPRDGLRDDRVADGIGRENRSEKARHRQNEGEVCERDPREEPHEGGAGPACLKGGTVVGRRAAPLRHERPELQEQCEEKRAQPNREHRA